MMTVGVAKNPNAIVKKALIALGFLTIVYNLKNYLAINEKTPPEN